MADVPTGGGGAGIPRESWRIYPGQNKSKYPGPFNPYADGYNARVHGPYDPARYYGEGKLNDWWNVKLKDMPLRIFEADRTTPTIRHRVTLFVNKMVKKWARPKKSFFPIMPLYGFMMMWYMVMYRHPIEHEKQSVYHW